MRLLGVLLQLTVTVSAPDTVRARVPFTLVVQIGTPAGRVVQLTPPAFGSFSTVKVARLVDRDSTGPAARVGRGDWERHEYRYTLIAPTEGRFGFSPFLVRAGAATARSRALAFVVQDAPPPAPARPRVLTSARINPARAVDVHAVASADTIWRGEQLTYSVGVFLDEFARSRLRRNPEFVPPEVRGAISYPLRGVPRVSFTRDVGAKRYAAYVFERALFPVAAGELHVPAARLTYALPQGPGYFSREESFTLAAESLLVIVREPPIDGRPGDWRGAVGQLTASGRIDTSRTRVGDPVTLTLRVAGTGNIELLPRPALALPWATLVTGSERVSIDSTGPALRGVKEFDWLLTPNDSGAKSIPSIRYPFFDPLRAQYRTLETVPIALTVGGSATVAALSGAVDALPTAGGRGGAIDAPFALLDAPARHPADAPTWWWWGAWAALAATTLGLLVVPRRGGSRRTSPKAARDSLESVGALQDAGDVARARRAWLNALASRVPDVSASADQSQVERALRRAGAREPSVVAICAALASLDAVAFGGADRTAAPSPAELLGLLDALERETVRPRLPRAMTLLLVAASTMLLLPANLVGAQAPSWADGVAAYEGGRFADARDAFLSAAASSPADRAAWRNAGVAAWRVGDTVTATWAWQRALRLDPRDAAVRELLEGLPNMVGRADAAVPPVPSAWLQWASMGALLLALALAAAARRRPVVLLRRVAWSLLLLSGAAFGGARWIARRVEAPRLAIALRDAVSRRDPTMTAEPVASITAGDILTVVDGRSGWLRIRVDATHDGWVPEPLLGSLDRRSLTR